LGWVDGLERRCSGVRDIASELLRVKVVVVEDNAGIREIVVDLLKGRGHDVAAFADAESAWAWAADATFELAILDWGLPGMDGLELCRLIRNAKDGERAVILVLTGRAEPDDFDEVVDAGANDYLSKPFKLDALEIRVAFAERQVVQHELQYRAKVALNQSAQLHRELALAAQRHADQLRLLDRVRAALAGELEVEQIYRTVVDATADILGYAYTSLYTVDGDHLALRRQVGYHDPAMIYWTLPLGEGIAGTVAETGTPVLINDARSKPDFFAADDEVMHEICVPIHDDGKIVGVFNVESIAEHPLSDDDFKLLLGVAELVSAAVNRSRLYEEAREREQVLRRVLNSVQEVVFTADAQGRWTFLNRAWETITGFAVAECLGKPASDFARQEFGDRFAAAVSALSNGAELELRGDLEIVIASGGFRWVEAHASRSTEGEPPFEISGTLIDITERKRVEAQLLESQDRFRHLAMHDPLTSLPNRSLFLERLEAALADQSSDSECASVLFLDLDGFKLVNDTFGHAIGDRLLVQVGERLSLCVRPADTIARLGGDEFAVLLVNTRSTTVSVEIAQRMLSALRPHFTIDGNEVALFASIGIASHRGPGGRGSDLLRNADTALYAAKADGRGISTTYEPSMSAAVLARYRQESELRQAIENDEFLVLYQPVFDLRTRELFGIEALVRWRHSERGVLLPAEFIQLAESTGLIVPLGERVLKQVCADVRAWRSRIGRPIPTIGVNISARQLRESSLVADIAALLAESGVEPASIELEIVESALALHGEMSAVRQRMLELRELGVSLTIDDFGAGFSSLASLRDLPVNGVKIDRSFISGLGRDQAGAAVVRAIAALAQSLDLSVTAEGIETIEQLAHIRSIGIERGQGFYFARPLTSEAIEHLIVENAPLGTDLLVSR
jgi:diguanylate cyclase (GGDEF)-like protein/PAS domain S-box-containing protein